MKSATINSIASAAGLSLLVTACAGFPEAYPPPANPFLPGATPLQNTTLAQPAKFGLVWLVPAGSAVPSQEAQRKMAEKIKAQFTAGKRLEIIGTAHFRDGLFGGSRPGKRKESVFCRGQRRSAASGYQLRGRPTLLPEYCAGTHQRIYLPGRGNISSRSGAGSRP